MSSQFTQLLSSLIRHRGVTGCLVVGDRDGLIVDSHLQIGVDGAAVAALGASLYRKARRSAAAARFGDAGFFELGAEHGRVFVVGRNGLLVVVVATGQVNVGLVRVEMLQGLELFG